MMSFKKYEFRASQLSKITGGRIGLTEKQKERLLFLQTRKMGAAVGEKDSAGKLITPLSPNMVIELKTLFDANANKDLPKTMRTELRKIHRAETYGRNFNFIDKRTQKGIVQEEEGITLLQIYLNSMGHKILFSKNKKRLHNGTITGLPDLNPIIMDNFKTGLDVKCSWELETFPFEEDALMDAYDTQNQGYIWLSDSERWITAYCLVNVHEHGLFNEKMKFWYPLGCPTAEDDKYYDRYVSECRELEKRLIFDYDRFVEHYPAHQLSYSKDEWRGEGLDIPVEDRVILKTTMRDESKIRHIAKRIELSREYLCNLK